jgi:hypothetical protein
VKIVAGTQKPSFLELPGQKNKGFLVLIALKQLFLKHARNVFGEILVRT